MKVSFMLKFNHEWLNTYLPRPVREKCIDLVKISCYSPLKSSNYFIMATLCTGEPLDIA